MEIRSAVFFTSPMWAKRLPPCWTVELEGPVNIGSDEKIAIADLLDSHRAGKSAAPDLLRLGARPAAPREPPLLVPEIHRLRDEAGWRPRFTLNRGLSDTIEWWRGRLDAGSERVAPDEYSPRLAPDCRAFSPGTRRHRDVLLLAARLLRAERYAATLATVGTWNLCLGAWRRLVRDRHGLGCGASC